MNSGIWKYADKLKKVDSSNWCSLDEGNTTLSSYDGISIKREDLNPTGSYKDRGASYRISVAKQNGENELVVTSTGNFAVSMATYGQKFGVKIILFVPSNISEEKRAILAKSDAVVYEVEKPILQAQKYAEQNNISYVRQSLDLDVLEGFKTLMLEILQSNIDFDYIVFPVSSGSLLLSSYQVLVEQKTIKIPKLIAVQTSYNTYIAREFYTDYEKSQHPSIASSLNVKVRPVKLQEVVDAIKYTNGSAFVVDEQDIISTKDLLWNNNIKVGYESSACFFAVKKMNLKGNVLVISTGVLR